ncbi:MAG: hypothetical protein IM600_14530 [Bacteroidetes bacterium]|nr:hypothetical protein [Bacteroidota bacterium]MCA6444646.1 hypothetical protein [Bacteroidota bacterium]
MGTKKQLLKLKIKLCVLIFFILSVKIIIAQNDTLIYGNQKIKLVKNNKIVKEYNVDIPFSAFGHLMLSDSIIYVINSNQRDGRVSSYNFSGYRIQKDTLIQVYKYHFSLQRMKYFLKMKFNKDKQLCIFVESPNANFNYCYNISSVTQENLDTLNNNIRRIVNIDFGQSKNKK